MNEAKGWIMSQTRREFGHLAAATALLGSSPAWAQADWVPQQQMRLLVGFAPGGAVDILIRIVAEGAQRLRGVSMLPENRSGAGGFIAAQATARAAPDGLTLCSAGMSMMSVLPAIPGVPIPLDIDRELTPVANLAGAPMALVIRPDAPFSDIDGLVAYVRSRNGAATYASTGNGTSNHLGGAVVCNALGLEMTHVTYRGGAPATLDVSAGRIDMMIANVSEVIPQIRAGQLRTLGVTARTPTPLAPDLLPLASRIPDIEINNWFGLAGPAGMPANVRAGLGHLFESIVKDSQTSRTLIERGLVPIGEHGDMFAERIQRDRARWRAVAEANNIRGE